ncbi:Cycloartenol-C-24-methyltransferase, partial [Mucuna pruriens]
MLQYECYMEIFKVLKPCQCFAAYEWLMIEAFDSNNEEHQKIKVRALKFVGLTPKGSPTVEEIQQKASEKLVELEIKQ